MAAARKPKPPTPPTSAKNRANRAVGMKARSDKRRAGDKNPNEGVLQKRTPVGLKAREGMAASLNGRPKKKVSPFSGGTAISKQMFPSPGAKYVTRRGTTTSAKKK